MSTTLPDALVVFARAPLRGHVKSRLAVDVGPDAALAAYRELGTTTWRAALQVRDAIACHLCIRFTPADALEVVEHWLPGADAYEAQAAGDLGDRMHAAISATFCDGARRIVVIGTDCPAISVGVLDSAFAALADADLVIGPAVDGGYYLVGMTAPRAALFANMPWGTSVVLRETLARAAVAGLRVAQLVTLADVDTVEDWRAWKGTSP